EALHMAQKAVRRFVNSNNSSVYIILNFVTEELCDAGRATEALKLVNDIAETIGPAKTFSDLFSYHSALAGCYLSLNNPDQAEVEITIMDSLETKAESVRGPLSRSIVTDMYGHLFFKRGQYQKARKYFEKQFTVRAY